MAPSTTPALSRIRCIVSAGVLGGAAIYAALLPCAAIVSDLRDPALRRGGVSALAWRVHKSLTPRFEQWARQRVALAAGSRVAPDDVSATEWPMFGTVFYLVATDHLQQTAIAAGRAGPPPNEYAAAAVDAAAALLIDPANAAWVRAKWGDDYLHRENVFYRMLLIRGLTSHARLTNSSAHRELLRDQVESLASAIDAAPSGFLNDYPSEAYPTDVVWAVAAIRAADGILGTDHRAMAKRFLERSQRPMALGRLGLPPYQIDAPSGRAFDDSRGCSNSGLLMYLPDLDAGLAARWYEAYVEHFWQMRIGAIGFREFPLDVEVERWWDVDAGPVLFGYGFAATAFGIGAARANGRLDHAVPLTALALAASWPLPDGTLLLPRALSHATEAPYLGEAGMLFILSRPLPAGTTPADGVGFPALLYVILAAYAGVALILLWGAFTELRRVRRTTEHRKGAAVANTLWIGLLVVAVVALSSGSWHGAAAALALACVLPSRIERSAG